MPNYTHFTPMNKEQKEYIRKVALTTEEEILIKHTGREGIELEMHTHEQFQIILTLQGTLHVVVNEIAYFVPEGHICWIPSGFLHSLSSNNRKIALAIYYVLLKFAKGDRRGKFAIYNSSRWASENMHYLCDTQGVLKKSVNRDLYTFGISFFRQLPLASTVYEIPLNGIIATRDSRLEPALRFINDNLSKDIRLEDVARASQLSVRSLSRLFHDMGIRYNNYLNYQRITRAVELLEDGDMNVGHIAFETGFSSPANFNRTFKQVMGITPTELVKKNYL